MIGTGGGRLATSPRLCRVWVNRGPGGTTFDEAASDSPKSAQEFELLESEGGQRGAVEYPVRIARFANCSDVDLVSRSTFRPPESAAAYTPLCLEQIQVLTLSCPHPQYFVRDALPGFADAESGSFDPCIPCPIDRQMLEANSHDSITSASSASRACSRRKRTSP